MSAPRSLSPADIELIQEKMGADVRKQIERRARQREEDSRYIAEMLGIKSSASMRYHFRR